MSKFQIAKAYVPPHLRGTNKVPNFKTKLHEDDEKPDAKLKIKLAAVDETEKKIKNIKKVKKKFLFYTILRDYLIFF